MLERLADFRLKHDEDCDESELEEIRQHAADHHQIKIRRNNKQNDKQEKALYKLPRARFAHKLDHTVDQKCNDDNINGIFKLKIHGNAHHPLPPGSNGFKNLIQSIHLFAQDSAVHAHGAHPLHTIYFLQNLNAYCI